MVDLADFGEVVTPETDGHVAMRLEELRVGRQGADSFPCGRLSRLPTEAADGVYRRPMTASDTHRTIDAVWRIELPKLIAGLARMVRDVGRAEELAQDALVAALEQWPQTGRAAQSRRLADAAGQAPRHRPAAPRASCLARKHEELGREPRKRRRRRPISTRRSTTMSATICCG